MDNHYRRMIEVIDRLDRNLSTHDFPLAADRIPGPPADEVARRLQRELGVEPTGDIVAWFQWYGGSRNLWCLAPAHAANGLDEAISDTRLFLEGEGPWPFLHRADDCFVDPRYRLPAIVVFRNGLTDFAPLTDPSIGLFTKPHDNLAWIPYINVRRAPSARDLSWEELCAAERRQRSSPTFPQYLDALAEAIETRRLVPTRESGIIPASYVGQPDHQRDPDASLYPWLPAR